MPLVAVAHLFPSTHKFAAPVNVVGEAAIECLLPSCKKLSVLSVERLFADAYKDPVPPNINEIEPETPLADKLKPLYPPVAALDVQKTRLSKDPPINTIVETIVVFKSSNRAESVTDDSSVPLNKQPVGSNVVPVDSGNDGAVP